MGTVEIPTLSSISYKTELSVMNEGYFYMLRWLKKISRSLNIVETD